MKLVKAHKTLTLELIVIASESIGDMQGNWELLGFHVIHISLINVLIFHHDNGKL